MSLLKDRYIIDDVEVTDNISLDKFNYFYDNIFLNEFSNPHICESKEHYINALRLKNINAANDLFISLLFDQDENIIGGIIYVYLSAINCGVIEYEVIDSRYRNMGFGQRLYKYAKEKLNSIAILSGRDKVDYIFGEVIKPEVISQFNAYEKFWNKLEFGKLDCIYIQPSINDNSNKSKDYMLMVYSNDNGEYIPLDFLKRVINEYFTYSFEINKAKINRDLDEMFGNFKVTNVNIVK